MNFAKKRLRPPWRSPVGALVLAAVSVGVGLIGYQQVTAEPSEQIEFLVEEGLPDNITQETVEAAAEGLAYSYEPFTMEVVERELNWDETQRGDFENPETDVLFSMGSDADPDTSLQDFTRVAFRGSGSSDPSLSDARDVRAAFVNNQTLGHGPHAVVGAAMTAADVRFDGGNRSEIYWAAISALPMFIAILVMYVWTRDRNTERKRAQQLSAAQLRLARVVLELDSLEVRFEMAQHVLQSGNTSETEHHLELLQQEWQEVRSLSLELARHERRLQSIFRDHARLEPAETMEEALQDLEDFDELCRGVKRQADAIADATELLSGHVGSRSVLDRIALPLIQALDEILSHRDQLPGPVEDLAQDRTDLLALSHQASSNQDLETFHTPEADASDAARLVHDHTSLLEQWDAVEHRVRQHTAEILTTLRQQVKEAGKGVTTERLLNKAASERAEQRILTMTAGEVESFQELRASLGLGHGTETGPLQAAERVLEVLDMGQTDYSPSRQAAEQNQAAPVLGVMLLPIVIAIGAGWWASSQVTSPATYGRELTGEEPLAGLNVYGDPQLLPEDPDPTFDDDPSQAESLTLEYIQESMQRSVDSSSNAALLPDELTLTVAIVDADEYIDYQWESPDFDRNINIPYWFLIEGQRQLKADVGEEFPEVLDPATGDIRIGQGILPVWILDEQTYAVGYTMTGEISSGTDSRLGRYSFQATEPTRIGPEEESMRIIGDVVAYDLQELSRALEHNHMETSNVDPGSVFWMTSISAWTGQLMVLILGGAVAESSRRRVGTKESRAQLDALSSQLNDLAMGLDMARLDMVAVLGGDDSSETGGNAEQTEQRLYEAGLVTAWREVEDLKNLPRQEQKGEAWDSRVANVQELVDMVSTRSEDISTRADELLRSQRSISEFT